MTTHDEERDFRALLAPLERVEPVLRRERKRSRRPLAVAALTAAALLLTAVAIGGHVNPLAGIGAANHPPTAKDALDPTLAARMRSGNLMLLPDTARLVGRLASGYRFYVVTTTTHLLCLVVAQRAGATSGSCGDPLSQARPTTIGSQQRVHNGPNATPPIFYGVAKDGISAVSFLAHGKTRTVPVTNNVWFYEGHSQALLSLTVHYANGKTQTLTS